jgi:thioester reductase-like protein
MASKLTVLVVGSTGMLGRKIVSNLLDKGAVEVKAMVRPGSDSKEENRQKIEQMKAQGQLLLQET